MRTVDFAVPMRSIKFRTQLRLEAAACLFELCFGSRHVSQHCVQAFWAQHHESERNQEG